ncbi:MAG: FAD-dependent oxidoreductase [Acidimicrobiales bacterium]
MQADAFVGSPSVTGVRLADGEILSADLMVATTVVKPHIEFLNGSGIMTDWGVHVDDRMSTSVNGIVAAGDVAEAADWLTGERFVHAIFPNAVAQAPIAAANLLGADVRYEGAEAMNSLKHLGVPIVAMGTIDKPDEALRWQGGGALRSVYVRDDRVVGAQLGGDIRTAGLNHSLMLRRVSVSRFGQRLVEPGFGMADIVSNALPYGRPAEALVSTARV